MITVDAVRDRLAEIDRVSSHRDLPFRELCLSDTGGLVIGSESFELAKDSTNRLCKSQRIPVEFADRIARDLLATVFNRLQEDKPIRSEVRLNIQNDRVVTHISEPGLITLSNEPVFDEVLAGFTEGSERDVKDLKVAEFRPRAGLISVLLYTETIDHEPRKGDLLYPGISIVHSSTGSHATQVATFIRRLVCQNGMTIRVCENEHKLRIRRLAQDGFDERDVLKQVRDMARKASTDFKVKLDAFGLLRDNKVANPEAALRRIARRLHLKKKLSDQLLQAFYEDELGVDETAYGLVNALARFVTHSPDLGDIQRIHLMETAGTYTQSSIRQCRLCSSILVDCPEVEPSTTGTASATARGSSLDTDNGAGPPPSEEAGASDDRGADPEIETRPASATDTAYARLIELPSKKTITRAELAEIFGKSLKTIRRWVAKGDLPQPARTGRSSFWSAGEILDHIRKRQETATVRD